MSKSKKTNGVVFPFPIISDLTENQIKHWQHFYNHPIVVSRNKKIEEGLWRRTQNYENKEQSGWKNEEDKRRRMVHYQYAYDLIEESSTQIMLTIVDFYIWWHICMPECEVSVYSEHIYASLQLGGWSRLYGIGGEEVFCFGQLYLRISKYSPQGNEYDYRVSREFPDNYKILEVTIFSSGNTKDEDFIAQPWKILETGIRKKDTRGSPTLNPWDKVMDFFPAQVELGCGPSIEADIPPLHFLHDVYSVTNKKTGAFILDPYQDCLARFIASNPTKALADLSEMYRRCFVARPTSFHHGLKSLYDRGQIVGPVITNNFDGLVHCVGLTELFVRRYDESHAVPNITFHQKAKSLIVVGSHADRRRIQHAAREAGLQVVYVDPEGYRESDGFTEYLLESPQDNDFLFRCSASEFIERIKNILA
jgi:hypothetical protein